MGPENKPTGIALLCDGQAIIQEVIHDGLGLDGLAPGEPLSQLVDAASRIKLLNFLVQAREERAALCWEINVPGDGEVTTLRLSGVAYDKGLIITGVRAPAYRQEPQAGTLEVDGQDTAVLRAAVKGQITQTEEEGDTPLYDEFSRLNNDLVTLQRALAKKNAELERLYAEVQNLAITDPLTGLYNRRGFFEAGQSEVNRARRYGDTLSAIIFDLDHFKQVNDCYGHTIGDEVLKKITARCRDTLRKVDIFGRYGGEEFAVLLPETALEGAHKVAERLRHTAASPIATEKGSLTVTISLGVAATREDTSDAHELLQRADRALYEAKNSGRNRTCLDRG
ncbi:MAG: GGDEF domain-containing protein [Anaerolineales bacterium]